MKEVNLKNMVVLKDFPSNIVEEAIVILKSNIKIKELERIQKKEQLENDTNNKNKENSSKKNLRDRAYILKEAEMLITNYISDIEQNNKKVKLQNKKANKKYERVKKYAYISSIIIVIQAIVIMIK